jgi:hypothetical protein
LEKLRQFVKSSVDGAWGHVAVFEEVAIIVFHERKTGFESIIALSPIIYSRYL